MTFSSPPPKINTLYSYFSVIKAPAGSGPETAFSFAKPASTTPTSSSSTSNQQIPTFSTNDTSSSGGFVLSPSRRYPSYGFSTHSSNNSSSSSSATRSPLHKKLVMEAMGRRSPPGSSSSYAMAAMTPRTPATHHSSSSSSSAKSFQFFDQSSSQSQQSFFQHGMNQQALPTPVTPMNGSSSSSSSTIVPSATSMGILNTPGYELPRGRWIVDKYPDSPSQQQQPPQQQPQVLSETSSYIPPLTTSELQLLQQQEQNLLEEDYVCFLQMEKVWRSIPGLTMEQEMTLKQPWFGCDLTGLTFHPGQTKDGARLLGITQDDHVILKRYLEQTLGVMLPLIPTMKVASLSSLPTQCSNVTAYQELSTEIATFNRNHELARRRAKIIKSATKDLHKGYTLTKQRRKFLCLDVEAYEFNHALILELGYTVATWRGQSYVLKDHHLIISETVDVVNGKKVADKKFAFNFGQSLTLPFHKAISRLRMALKSADYIIGHALGSDEKFLRKFGIDFRGKCVLDTQSLLKSVANVPDCWRLSRILDYCGLDYSNLHNAGNDAHYTMEAFLWLAMKGGKDVNHCFAGNVETVIKSVCENGLTIFTPVFKAGDLNSSEEEEQEGFQEQQHALLIPGPILAQQHSSNSSNISTRRMEMKSNDVNSLSLVNVYSSVDMEVTRGFGKEDEAVVLEEDVMMVMD